MGQRRRFTPEFKRQAVQLVNAGPRPRSPVSSAFHAIVSINGRRKWPRMAGHSLDPGDKPNPQPNLPGSSGSWPE